jgi:hypothetical protein
MAYAWRWHARVFCMRVSLALRRLRSYLLAQVALRLLSVGDAELALHEAELFHAALLVQEVLRRVGGCASVCERVVCERVVCESVCVVVRWAGSVGMGVWVDSVRCLWYPLTCTFHARTL